MTLGKNFFFMQNYQESSEHFALALKLKYNDSVASIWLGITQYYLGL